MKKGRMALGSCSEPCGHVMPYNPNLSKALIRMVVENQ